MPARQLAHRCARSPSPSAWQDRIIYSDRKYTAEHAPLHQPITAQELISQAVWDMFIKDLFLHTWDRNWHAQKKPWMNSAQVIKIERFDSAKMEPRLGLKVLWLDTSESILWDLRRYSRF